jgi:hypothetical protein
VHGGVRRLDTVVYVYLLFPRLFCAIDIWRHIASCVDSYRGRGRSMAFNTFLVLVPPLSGGNGSVTEEQLETV